MYIGSFTVQNLLNVTQVTGSKAVNELVLDCMTLEHPCNITVVGLAAI